MNRNREFAETTNKMENESGAHNRLNGLTFNNPALKKRKRNPVKPLRRISETVWRIDIQVYLKRYHLWS